MLKVIYKKLKTILFVICLSPSIIFAGFTITPLNVELSKENKVVNMTLKNTGAEGTSFETQILKATYDKDGKISWVPNDDFIIVPRRDAIAPGGSQTVRLAMKNNIMYSIGDNMYKISAKELPRKMNTKGSQVQLVTEFRIPLKVTENINNKDNESNQSK
jgi:P pilus assembly chaperone PapD